MSHKDTKRLTSKDIARLAGVSQATVSQLGVRPQHPMEPDQVQPRPRHQRRQPLVLTGAPIFVALKTSNVEVDCA